MVDTTKHVDEKIISFANRSLKLDTSEDASLIVSALNKNIDVSVLNLSGNTLGINAAEPIGVALGKNIHIKKCLFSDLFTGRLKSEIAPALRHLSSGIIASGAQLIELDLSDNAFGPNGVVGVTELLASQACYSLEVLRMNNQGLGHEGCRHLAMALHKGRRSSGKKGLLLKVFSGGRNRFENVGAQLLSEVFMDMGSLEELSLYQNGIGIHGLDGALTLVKIIKHNPHLRILNLSDNSLTPKGGKAIAKSLSSLPNLEELYLSDCILRSAGAQALAAALDDNEITPNLRILNLTGNEIRTSAGIKLILSLANKSQLQLLDLNANEFGPQGIQTIIHTMDSVGLLHTLPKTFANSGDEESLHDDLCKLSFDEDQGSDGEDEEVASEEEANNDEEICDYVEDDGDGDYDDDDEYTPTRDVDTSGEQNENCNGGAPLNFSFREAQLKLEQSGCLSNTQQSNVFQTQKLVNGGKPFGSPNLGLFSSITPTAAVKPNTDAVDTAAIRSKLITNGFGNLFSSANNFSTLSGKGNLFSPPILSAHLSNDIATQPKMDENKFEILLSQALTCPKDASARSCLIDFLRQSGTFQQPPVHPTILKCTHSSIPENVVRLSLVMASNSETPSNSRFVLDPVLQTAIGLLASLLTNPTSTAASTPTDKGKLNTDKLNRAITCLLVYLGAIKPEKDSEDWVVTRSYINPREYEHCLSAYLRLTKQLIEYFGPQLIPSVCNCLTVLLSKQQDRRETENVDPETKLGSHQLRKDLLKTLEQHMSQMQLK